MSLVIHEGHPRPDDVMEGSSLVGGCTEERGSVEDYLGDGSWVMCWRPRHHGGVHWDEADQIAWYDDAPAQPATVAA